MIMSPPALPEIGAEHLARRALIYVRPSTPEQLQLNPESTARQYALRRGPTTSAGPPSRWS